MKSQNATFVGSVDVSGHPPGESVAVALRSQLASHGWDASEPEIWRDCGWSLECRGSFVALAVILTRDGERWFLQIAPIEMPGALGRLFGRTPSATASDIYELAQQVHSILSLLHFSEARWRWDGPPDENSAREPPPPP